MGLQPQFVRQQRDPDQRNYRGDYGGPGWLAYSFVTEEMVNEIPEPWQITVPCGFSVTNVTLNADVEYLGAGDTFFSVRTVVNPSEENIPVGESYSERFKWGLTQSGAFQYTFQFPMLIEPLDPVTFQFHPLLEGPISISKVYFQANFEVSGLYYVDKTLEDPRIDPDAGIVLRQPFKIQLLEEEEDGS